jgi:predicted ATP-grasp superfamily ATP-dependent carboligase
MMGRGDRDPLAVVMGDVDLVRALGVAGISSAFFGFADDSARLSRHVRVSLPWMDQWERQEELAEALLALALAQPQPPVLFPQTDAALLLASRYRERLAEGLQLMLADRQLLDQLLDKDRFAALAARHDLPVPPAQRLRAAPDAPAPRLEVPFPLVVKPLTRTPAWTNMAGASKALHVLRREDFEALWPRLTDARIDVLAQQLIGGPESHIESFHVYVDASGSIAGEFTGRKIRTFPRHYGQSTAVEVVPLADVAELGREVVDRLALRGVAKLDFKRDDRGRLHLLEVNPRFNLWHYPGALAGVNLPATVYADLTGRERPPAAVPHRRVTWLDPLQDLRAVRAQRMPLLAWLRWARGCEAISGLAREDPMPFMRGKLWGAVRRRMAGHAIRIVRTSGAGRIAPRARRGTAPSSE